MMKLHWKDLGIAGKQRVRDFWRQKDLGTLKENLQQK